jgi:hypothetical protein
MAETEAEKNRAVLERMRAELETRKAKTQRNSAVIAAAVLGLAWIVYVFRKLAGRR